MASDDITVQILRDIRDEIRGTNKRIDDTNKRVTETNARLEVHIKATNEGFAEMSTRLVASEIRTATAIAGLAGTMSDVRDLLRDRLDLRDRVERCEHDIAELKNRLG